MFAWDSDTLTAIPILHHLHLFNSVPDHPRFCRDLKARHLCSSCPAFPDEHHQPELPVLSRRVHLSTRQLRWSWSHCSKLAFLLPPLVLQPLVRLVVEIFIAQALKGLGSVERGRQQLLGPLFKITDLAKKRNPILFP